MALAERAAADAGLLRADVGARVDEIDELRRGADLRDERHRRTQGAEPEPEPEIGRNVTEMKSDGSKDAEAWREKDTGGPRRLQANKCSGPELASHTNAIAVECCDEPTEDCSDGYPHTCNAGCAGLLLPFWDDCCAQLADLARVKLGSRPREPLRHRLLRLPSAPETPLLRSDTAPRASSSRTSPRETPAGFSHPLLARQAAKRSA